MNRTPSNHPTSQEKGKAARFRVTPVTLALGIYILLLLSRLLDASVLIIKHELKSRDPLRTGKNKHFGNLYRRKQIPEK